MQKDQQWKHKVQELFQTAQTELKRTTEIGKKMFNATKTNTNLNEAYEELGQLTAKALNRGDLDWSHARVKELLIVIKACKEDLVKIEGEVQDIKFADNSNLKTAESNTNVETEAKSESDKK